MRDTMPPTTRPAVRPRGRPPKYGKPGHLIAVTLPDEILDALRRIHSDIGWAIVSAVESRSAGSALPAPKGGPPTAAVALADIGAEQALIVVTTALFRTLPGVQLIPFSATQSFLALAPGQGMADLEVTVIDRLESGRARPREAEALSRLLVQLRKWRRDRNLTFEARSIILVRKSRPGR